MTEEQILQTLLAIVRDVVDDEDVEFGPRSTIKDIPGWDSLNNTHILVRLEKKMCVQFQQADFEKVTTIGELVEAVALKLKK